MIKLLAFKNYKVLRDAELPLGRFTLIVGANGSGKTTALEAFSLLGRVRSSNLQNLISVEVREQLQPSVEIAAHFDEDDAGLILRAKWTNMTRTSEFDGPEGAMDDVKGVIRDKLQRARIFSFRPDSIVQPVQLRPGIELENSGSGLAGVLDNLRDREPERFEALNAELSRWLPEFDRILFDTTHNGMRAFLLRTHSGRHRIPADDLSHGTLIAVAFLTLSYLPDPPSIIGLEEPELFIHPRLLRELVDGMYRLSYPESHGDLRPPVQVIATTHSPYLLDLYKDHPEEVVIAEKDERGGRFERLSDKTDVDEFLQGASLGDVWYSGVLGGVPIRP